MPSRRDRTRPHRRTNADGLRSLRPTTILRTADDTPRRAHGTSRARRSARQGRRSGRVRSIRRRRPRFGSSPYPGLPYPLGATPYQGGTNFAVVADGVPGVSDVLLCLLDAAGSAAVPVMDERTYGIWHTFVPDVGPGQVYGFRVPARDPDKILLDPYARRVTTTEYDLVAAASYGADTLGSVPLAVVVDSTGPAARSTSVRPWVPWEQTVIYEAHVTGLTKLHPDVPKELQGTFKGVCHPAVIEHLKSLSVTTLELLPVHASAAEPGLLATHRRNYWGYSTLTYFAPHPRYATAPGRETRRVRRDGRRAARGGHRGGAGRRLQPHLRGRTGSVGGPVLARALAGVVLPAGRPGHHRHRQHRERRRRCRWSGWSPIRCGTGPTPLAWTASGSIWHRCTAGRTAARSTRVRRC